jgi:arsenite-transporting ATPase
LTLKEKLSGILGMMGGGQGNSLEKMFDKISKLKEETSHLKEVISNPQLTTFVAVCIPEFLSVYETERLVQELTTYDIDIFNIVVNQIVFPEEGSKCGQCISRFKMQRKYLNQIFELYEDFHVVMMGLERSEIRGTDRLQSYAQKLLQEKTLPQIE